MEIRGIYSTFCAKFGYRIRFASILGFKNEKPSTKNVFSPVLSEIYLFFAFSSSISDPCQTFLSSVFIPKDAEFQGLSDDQ